VDTAEAILAVKTNTELLRGTLCGKLATNPGPLKRYILRKILRHPNNLLFFYGIHKRALNVKIQEYTKKMHYIKIYSFHN
jgi:hypothetical protein